MSLERVRTRENAKGGGLLKARQIFPTPSDTFLDWGWLGGTTLDDKRDIVESKDEVGDLVIVLESGRMATLATLLQQTSQDEIDLVNNANGKFYDLWYTALLANGDTQSLSAGVCQIKPGAKLDYKPGQRVIEVTLYMLAPKAAFTRTPSTLNIVSRVPYVMVTATTPTAIPTDTASSLWTACG
jgi:hypothetical protein